jgi:hypothetical protein
MRLLQKGGRVAGTYSYASGSTISGTAEKNRLTFTYREPSAAGEGWFELSADGQSFRGQWRPQGNSTYQSWTGKRVNPEPGKVYLVVLEANWENHLAQPEYSFGQMLKSFFTRAPNVQVRQRYFSDEASLRRWLDELAYLAEPFVLSISTHAGPEGVHVNGQSIGAKVFAESLKNAGSLKLLHFSSCCAMQGKLPAEIQRGWGGQVAAPISGYTTTVDWGASAVVEFMYFDLILCRNLPPKDAAERLTKLIPFAGDKKVPGAPFASTGFKMLSPDGGQ